VKSRFVLCVSLAMICLFGASAFAQSVALPQPVAVVRDADGKVVAQVAGFTDYVTPLVILHVEGVAAVFVARAFGLEAVNSERVFYSGLGCTGEMYLPQPSGQGIEELTNTKLSVLGPDPSTGTYRVFKSTSTTPENITTLSHHGTNQDCEDDTMNGQRVTAEEVIPNPLAGFHGPTVANPERTWTIEGGDRLAQ